MISRRSIWLVAGVAVLVAAIVLVVREADGPPLEDGPGLADAMMTLLEHDSRAEKAETKEAVRAVAELVDHGRLDSPQGRYALGLHRMEVEAFDAAEHAFREAIAQEPGWSWPYSALGALLLKHTEGRTEEAEDVLRKAIELDPSWSRPHNDLAVLLRLSGRLQEAETEALAALRLAPQSVAAHNNYGNLLVVQERYAEAEPEYRKAMELDPAHPKPYYNLGCLYCLQGRSEEALALVKEAFALDDDLREYAGRDRDLDALRDHPEFIEALAGRNAAAASPTQQPPRDAPRS